jgi:membrane protein
VSLKDRIDRVRARWPFLDHLLHTQEHIGRVKANQQAGAITYFGFLSVFPILALAFAVVGLI